MITIRKEQIVMPSGRTFIITAVSLDDQEDQQDEPDEQLDEEDRDDELFKL